jgi:two-component system NtrC family sensor kinase
MAFVSNPGLLAAAFIEGSAVFVILVLYTLFAPGFPARFFRYWMAGWAFYFGLETLRIFSLWRGGPDLPPIGPWISLVAATLFFVAILECAGQGKYLRQIWPMGVIAASGIMGLGYAKLPNAAQWGQSLLECGLYLSSGWILWRSQSRHRGFGWKLLAGALLLQGLHGLDKPQWSAQEMGLFRVPFQGLLGITIGIAMAVLVLEASRSRMEDLNEKLRRLALITSQATQSLQVEEALRGVLVHLVESLNGSHGLIFLLDGSPDAPAALGLRASVGFSDAYRKQHSRISPNEPWVQKILQQETPLVAYQGTGHPELRRWMAEEGFTAIILIRVPGKELPLGVLGIASAAPRMFESDEENFLVNVANLLGLAVQNVSLSESAATSRQQWLDTFDSIDDLILVHAQDGRILRSNRALASRLKAEPAAIVGRFLRDVLPRGATRWIRCPYCEGAAGKAENTDPFFGGHLLATDSPFHDSAGGRLGTIHVLKDLTGRRQAEDKFRLLFEKVQEGVFISTPGGRFLDFNDALMRILGHEDRQQVLGIDISADLYVDPADRARLTRLLHEYGEVNDFEFRLRRRDGEIRTVQESSFAARDSSGTIVAYQGFLLDVTERKQAELEIRRRNRELLALNAVAELLAQSSALAEVLTSALHKIAELFTVDASAVYFFDESAKYLKLAAAVGYRTEHASRGRSIEVPPELVQQIQQARATLLSGSAPSLPEAFREAQRAEGFLISKIAVLRAKDRVAGFLVIGCREIREFSAAELNLLSAVGNQVAVAMDKSLLLEQTREAYESLRHTQEQLLQSEKMAAVGQLISGVAHELNNPLTAILGYSQLLQTEDLGAERSASYIDKLHKQALRTHHIVQNLLSFARQRKPERAPVNLNQIIEDTLVLREYDMKLNNIHVHREFDPRLPVTGGDFHQLQQVFLNILNNAVDAVREKDGRGDIWIRTEALGNRLRIEITDSGSGVQHPHRIFDPFYTTKPVGKGTGLGLSICYGIVKEHGGEIQVRNSPPRGATFTILLPHLVMTPSSHDENTAWSADHASGTILLVDDEEAVLQLEQEILLASGISVKVARSGQEAIDILKSGAVSAIVTDMKMPGGVSTLDLYRWVLRHRPELAARVIFTASDPQDSSVAEITRESGCAVLPKPFQIQDFWNVVQKVLSSAVSNGEVPSVLNHEQLKEFSPSGS